MGKLIGYAREIIGIQDLQPRRDAMKRAGCGNADIYTNKVSGARSDRPGLDGCVAVLEPRDTRVV